MRLSPAFGVPMLVAILLAASPPAEAGTRSETGRYVAFVGDVILICEGEFFSPLNLGGACFWTQPADQRVTITLVDDAGWTVAGYYGFYGEGGGIFEHSLDAGPLCGGATVPVPPGAIYMEVSVDGAFLALDCPGVVGAGPATTGTIHLEFITA